MIMSTDLNERIAAERKRLKEVRQTLTAAVNKQANGDASYVPFYIAIGDYFEATMERLHRQDIRMGDMLRDKADLSDKDNHFPSIFSLFLSLIIFPDFLPEIPGDCSSNDHQFFMALKWRPGWQYH